MVNNLHLNFLREKIGDLRNALLFSMSRSVLKLPNSIVTAIHVDEMGYIWLLAHRPLQDIKEFERDFPVKLDFYRKGRDYYLNVTGKATIVLEPSEIEEVAGSTDLKDYNLRDEWMLVRVEISDAAYHGMAPVSALENWKSVFTAQFNKFFFTPQIYHKSLAIH